MHSNLLVYSIIILNLVVLGGCASTTKVTKLSHEMQNLNKNVDNINLVSSKVKQTKSESDKVKNNIDNQIYLYHK